MVESRKDQPIGNHDATVNGEDGVPSVYAAMGVPTLQDQADAGGWLPHSHPIHAEPPDLATMGSRGNYKPVADKDDKLK